MKRNQKNCLVRRRYRQLAPELYARICGSGSLSKFGNVVQATIDRRHFVFRQFQKRNLLLPELVESQVIVGRRLLGNRACIFLKPSVSTPARPLLRSMHHFNTSATTYIVNGIVTLLLRAPPPHLAQHCSLRLSEFSKGRKALGLRVHSGRWERYATNDDAGLPQ